MPQDTRNEPTAKELNDEIVAEAEKRFFQHDYVVVRGGYSSDITIHHRDSVPHSVIESEHHEIIHAPEGWP